MIALLSVTAVGATKAWFLDTETSNGNSFTAGSLDLNIDGGNINVVKFTVGNMVPGNQPKSGFLLANVGSVKGYLDIENISVTNNENGRIEPEIAAGDTTDGVGELQDVVNLRLFLDYDGNGWIGTGETVFYNGKVGSLPSNFELNELLNVGSNVRIGAIFDWWTTPDDNKAMGDDMTLNMTFELGQTIGQ